MATRPQNVPALSRRANSVVKIGKTQEAIVQANQVLKLDQRKTRREASTENKFAVFRHMNVSWQQSSFGHSPAACKVGSPYIPEAKSLRISHSRNLNGKLLLV